MGRGDYPREGQSTYSTGRIACLYVRGILLKILVLCRIDHLVLASGLTYDEFRPSHRCFPREMMLNLPVEDYGTYLGLFSA